MMQDIGEVMLNRGLLPKSFIKTFKINLQKALKGRNISK